MGFNGTSLAKDLAALSRRMGGIASWLAPIALGVLIALSPIAIVERVRDLVFDEYQRWSPRVWSPDLPVRIVAIDDASIAAIGQWPWPRQRIADLTRKLADMGAAAIGFDIVFSETDRLSASAMLDQLPDVPERAALATALAARGVAMTDTLREAFAAAPVVLAETLSGEAGVAAAPETKANFVTLGDDASSALPLFARAIQPLADLRAAASGLGAINYIPDGDLIVRRAPLVMRAGPAGGAAFVPALALELLRVAQTTPPPEKSTPSPILKATGASGEKTFGGAPAVVSIKIGDFEIPTEADGQVRIRYAGRQPGRYVSALSVLSGKAKREEIEGRIVLVGVTAASLGDIRSTPIDAAVPGVEIHAEVIEHAISRARLERPDYARGVEAVALTIGGLLAALIARRLRPVAAALGILLLAAAAGLASWEAYTRLAQLYDPLIPAGAWLVTWASSTVAVYRRSERERRFVRTAFSRYLAPAVVERLAADPSSLKLGGEARDVTVLFCDARGFTARSESLDAEGIVRFLNELHTPLTAAVLAEAGTIDKYMGDGMMAFWNAPLPTPDHASRACHAALAMLDVVPRIDERMAKEAEAEGRVHTPVRIGVGVNSGRAFVGNMGSEQRFDYSLVGDPVNVAARLETVTKELGVPIVVSEATMRAARGFRFIDLGFVSLKGRAGAIRVHALHDRAHGEDTAFDEFRLLHNGALAAAERGDASQAIARARAHPLAKRYESFYARLASGVKITATEDGKAPGGS